MKTNRKLTKHSLKRTTIEPKKETRYKAVCNYESTNKREFVEPTRNPREITCAACLVRRMASK
jgi:hypothetical protein